MEPSTDLTRLNPIDCPCEFSITEAITEVISTGEQEKDPMVTTTKSTTMVYPQPYVVQTRYLSTHKPEGPVKTNENAPKPSRKRGRPPKVKMIIKSITLPSVAGKPQKTINIPEVMGGIPAMGKVNSIAEQCNEEQQQSKRLRWGPECLIATAHVAFMTIMASACSIPKDLTQALAKDSNFWTSPTMSEFLALKNSKTFWKPTPEELELLVTKGLKIHGTRAVLTVKMNRLGKVTRGKVRLVVQGYSMIQGVNFDSTFSPVAMMASIRLLVTTTCENGWEIRQVDCPNAYLNGKAQKLVFVKLPKHWNELMGDDLGKDGDPVIMDRSLYGAPNAGRNWNVVIHKFFLDQGYMQCMKEACIYVKHTTSTTLCTLFVNNILYMGGDHKEHERLEKGLQQAFNTRIMGELDYVFGIHFKWDNRGCHLDQSVDINKIVKRFHENTEKI